MENRRYPRLDHFSYLVDVSDGRGFFSGYVQNLSRFGLCLQDVSKKIDQDARRLSVVISSHDKYFKMLARVRWSEEKGPVKNLGLELINTPWNWTEFVMEKEPTPDDPWGQVNI